MSGISLLAGAPKSFLVLQIAYHVSTGKPLWGMTVRQSDVLYLALEDTAARLQRRSAWMFRENGSDCLHFAIAAKTIGSGLLEQLAEDVQTQIIPKLSKQRHSSAERFTLTQK